MIRHISFPGLVTGCALVMLLSGAAAAEPAKSKSRIGDDAGTLITRRTDKPDGTTALTIGRRLPTEWETQIGVDVGLDSSPVSPTVESRLDGSWQQDRSSGAGWASITVPTAPLGWDKAAIEARVDPTQDQGKVSTTLSKSIPLGSTTRLNVKNGYAVTEPIPNPVGSSLAAPNGSATSPSSAVATENTVSLHILPMATTLSAGATLSSSEDRWLRSIGAEQKLFGGPVSVTGTLSERADGAVDGSLKAGFKRQW
jgi:hypothetical protein